MMKAKCPTTRQSENTGATEQRTRRDPELFAQTSFLETAVRVPSPGSVHLQPESRLGARFRGNIDYVRYLHERYGEEMLEAYTVRHYAPGKLLELVWDREYAGKWLDAAVRIAVNTGDEDQLAMAGDFAASLRGCQQPDGYVGIKLPADRDLDDWEKGWDLWNQWYALTGLLTHYEYYGDPVSLEAAGHLGDWILKTYGPIEDGNAHFLEGEGRSMTVIGQLLRLYWHTGNEDLIDFVRHAARFYAPVGRMRSSREPELMHPYMLSAILGGMADLAHLGQDHEILAWVEAVWERMAGDHLYPTGSLGLGESLRENAPNDEPDKAHQETCATAEWIFFTQRLYGITGHVKYIEALENTCYNALLAAQSTDGMKWTYFTPLRYHKDWFHGPTKCCYWSGPRGIARLPQLVYATKDNAIYVNFFETSHAMLATRGGEVHVTQDSEFPEVGKSTVTLKAPLGWKGTLRIRRPRWTTEFQIKLNARVVPNAGDMKGYCDVRLQESREYLVGMHFDIPFVREEFAGGYLMRRGPEVLAIDVRDNIETVLNWISFPEEVVPQPTDSDGTRRRYCADLEYRSSGEPRRLMFTPYADAGNEGAAFRVVFPLESNKEQARSDAEVE